MEIKKHYCSLVCGAPIHCDVIPMGRDFTLCVYDQECGHVGAVALSMARPSLTGQGLGVTTSILNCPGHKDEVVARSFAEAVALSRNCTAVCTCGIHMDQITKKQIQEILSVCERLKKEVLADMNQEELPW